MGEMQKFTESLFIMGKLDFRLYLIIYFKKNKTNQGQVYLTQAKRNIKSDQLSERKSLHASVILTSLLR